MFECLGMRLCKLCTQQSMYDSFSVGVGTFGHLLLALLRSVLLSHLEPLVWPVLPQLLKVFVKK